MHACEKNCEQESFHLKRAIESLKNEYESKIYDLNDDISILNKKLKQYELSIALSNKFDTLNHQDSLELIQELKEKNQQLMGKFHLIESQLNTLSEKNQSLENQIDEKERTIQDNSRLMLNYQKEVRNFIFT